MKQKYNKLVFLIPVILFFGILLYIFQNTTGLLSFASSSQNAVCAKKWGTGWYYSGGRCVLTEKLYVPVGADGASYCRNSGPLVPASATNPYAYCKKNTYKAYPGSPPTTTTSTPPPAPTNPPQTPGGNTPSTTTPSEPQTIKISPATGVAQVGQAFTVTFTSTGGLGFNKWVEPSVPAGMTFNDGGTNGNPTITGTPTASGYQVISLKATDYLGTSGTLAYALTINNADGSAPAGSPPPGFGNNIVPPKNSSTAPGTKASGSGATGEIVGDFTNPLGADVDTVPKFILRVIRILLTLTGMLAVLFIIIGGLRYISSIGNPEAIKGAKNTIIYAVVGLTISILSFAIIQVITNLLVNK